VVIRHLITTACTQSRSLAVEKMGDGSHQGERLILCWQPEEVFRSHTREGGSFSLQNAATAAAWKKTNSGRVEEKGNVVEYRFRGAPGFARG